jgi:hypothetical protein
MNERLPIRARFSPEEDGCNPTNRAGNANSGRIKVLETRLRKTLKVQRILTDSSRTKEFGHQISACEIRSQRQKKLLQNAHRLSRNDILFWISDAYANGEVDEALWRSFLASHFGRGSTDHSDKVKSATKILCAFGAQPYWTWKRVSSAANTMKPWLIEHSDGVKALGFGNHRKYESKQSLIVYRVISSFVDWVHSNGGAPSSAFLTNGDAGPEANFELAYRSLKAIFRFGRTGAFDLLCLIGNMRVLPVRPGSCYLAGSTGPLRGARKLWGRRAPLELGELADSTATALGIPFDVFEDALCMWQK